MNKFLLRSLAFTAFSFSVVLAGNKTNKTTFTPRSPGADLPLQLLRWHSHTSDKGSNFGGRMQFNPFFEQSVNGSKVGKFFTFDNKQELSVKAGSSLTVAGGDVQPYNLNLTGAYDGKISFKPKRSVFGVEMSYVQDLKCMIHGLYFSITNPILYVQNDPGLRETISANGTTATHAGPLSITEFMKGARLTSDWSEPLKYGKVNGKQEITGMGDIDLKLGYAIVNNRSAKLAVNFAGTIPTSNKPDAEYMFQPLLGNGHHWAIGAGLDSSFHVWKSEKENDRYLHATLAADYRYLFEGHQMRTLELKGKKWGRFIRMRQADPRDTSEDRLLANSLPGINALTRNCKVTPGSQVDGIASICYKHNKHVHFNLGYNIWARESEKVSLKDSWTSAGKFGLISSNDAYQEEGVVTTVTKGSATGTEVESYPVYVNQNKLTSVVASTPWTIKKTGPADMFPKLVRPESKSTGISSDTTIAAYATGNGTYIQESDVDKAEHACAMSHKIYGGLDYTLDPERDYPVVLGLWGDYEFAQNNAALDQWAVWCKLGMAF